MQDESEAYADAAVASLSRSGAAAPGNFHSEITNALLQAERRGRINADDALAALKEILALPVAIEAPDPHAALKLAREHGLSCYDGAYLALALQLKSPLATVDQQLAAAARSLGVLWMPA